MSVAKDGGGSFREVRERHLDLFKEGDRAKGHGTKKVKKARDKPKRSRWTSVGILHFPAYCDGDEDS